MKGIVLAGGHGTRLYPSTKNISKQLLPIYDKPTIYYPISILMLSGIREILIISTPRDLPAIQSLLGNGESYGLNLKYKVQEEPKGIAQALILGEEFIGQSNVCLILGDNFFYGDRIGSILSETAKMSKGANIFAYQVKDPERYGVVEFDQEYSALSLEEKPKNPKSNWAVTGIYFYDNRASSFAKKLKPSKRGELEITDLNKEYLKTSELKVTPFGRGMAWLDTGTDDSLLNAAQFVQIIEKRQGLKIACLEEIALLKGFIDQTKFKEIAQNYPASGYGKYLKMLSRSL